jgi:hypothetical protein
MIFLWGFLMPWDNQSIAYYFDDNFLNLYCDEHIRRALDHNALLIINARSVLKRLAELAPNAAHVWRGYNWNPFVVMGKVINNRGNLANGQKFAIKLENGHFYFCFHNQWDDLGGGLMIAINNNVEIINQGVNYCWYRYNQSIDLNEGDIPVDHPLHDGHPLCELIQWFNDYDNWNHVQNIGDGVYYPGLFRNL